MRDECIHLSDEELLLFADGEMPGHRAKEARVHLQGCWQCRARMAKIETTIIDFVRVHSSAVDGELPPAAGPRALLKARLADLDEKSSRKRWHTFHSVFATRRLACACALVLIAMVGAGLYLRNVRQQSIATVFAGVLPNPQLTPGATMPVSIGEICSMPHDEVVRRVPVALQREVLREYGVPSTRANEYEVDYLITPGLGGAGDIRNLWPEPNVDTAWNSYVKDQLEERLHHLVCTGQIDLTTAQHQIASNWIAAYKRYVGGNQPISNRSTSSMAEPPGSWHNGKDRHRLAATAQSGLSADVRRYLPAEVCRSLAVGQEWHV